MKYIRITIIFLFTIPLLIACSTKSFDLHESEVNEVSVSLFKDFGMINEDDDIQKIFKEKEDIKAIVAAINTSTAISGDVDMPKGDYDLLLKLNVGTSEGFHLKVSGEMETGTIMKTEDTATAYQLTRKSTDQIRSVLSN